MIAVHGGTMRTPRLARGVTALAALSASLLAACTRDRPADPAGGFVEAPQGPDSVGALARLVERRTQTFERISEEKDTLIQTLHTAMLLFNELTDVEREIAGEEVRREESGLEPWDQRVRSQLQRLRTRYSDMAGRVSRAEERLRQLEGRDSRLRISLDEALRAAADLRADNERKQTLIDELNQRVAVLTGERDAAVALSVARSDTIQTLVTENNTVYWIAGTQSELKRLGLIEVVGGRSIIFTRIGETLSPSRTLGTENFQSIDRRRSSVIDLPEAGDYEILTKQDLSHADRSTVRRVGQRWLVRGQLRINDPRFWGQTRYLILVRH
jgi:hypothetical protein